MATTDNRARPGKDFENGLVSAVPEQIFQGGSANQSDEGSFSSRRRHRALKRHHSNERLTKHGVGNLAGSAPGNGTPTRFVGGQPNNGLHYIEWGNDDDDFEQQQQQQLDPNVYDYDYADEFSDAESEFTEDYSRHKHLISANGEESSLSSEEGSFDDMDMFDPSNWNSAGDAAAAVSNDARKPNHSNKPDGIQVDGIQGTLSTDYRGHLLVEEHSEFSEEEDPLFNLSGAIKMYAPSPSQGGDEVWSDDDEMNESWAPPPTDKIWRETADGEWVSKSSHAKRGGSSPPDRWRSDSGSFRHGDQASNPNAGGSADQKAYLLKRQASARSEGSISVDSFAGDNSQSSGRKGSSSGRSPRQGSKRPNSNFEAPQIPERLKPPAPPIPLKPDAKLQIDESDEEEEMAKNTAQDDVLVFSDDETPSPGVQTASGINDLPTNPIKSSMAHSTTLEDSTTVPSTSDDEVVVVAKEAEGLSRKRSSSPNPIIQSPRLSMLRKRPEQQQPQDGCLHHLDSPLHQQINEQPKIEAAEEIKLSLSPTEHMAPLKDHSRRPKKSKAAKSVQSATPTKSNKKKKKKDKKKETDPDDSENESIVSTTEFTSEVDGFVESMEGEDDGSIASECSNDSMDATGIARSKRSKTPTAKDSSSKKVKKSTKKKKKTERTRKRGRRADFEEDSLPDEAGDHKMAVADRVEAIFTDKQKIFDTTMQDEVDKNIQTEANNIGSDEQNTDSNRKMLAMVSEKSSSRSGVTDQSVQRGVRSTTPNPSAGTSAMEHEIHTFLSSLSEFNEADLPVGHTNVQPKTFRVKSKAAESYEGSKTSNNAGNSSTKSRSKSKSRSRSVSKDPAKSRSRSKSKDPSGSSESRSRSKSRSQSKREGRSRSTGRLRRKVKKDRQEPGNESEDVSPNDGVSVVTTQTMPASRPESVSPIGDLEQQLSRVAGNDSQRSTSGNHSTRTGLDTATVVTTATELTTQTAPAHLLQDSADGADASGEKIKRKGVKPTKSSSSRKGKDLSKDAKAAKRLSKPPISPRGIKESKARENSNGSTGTREDVTSSPYSMFNSPQPSKNAMTLRDFFDKGADTSDDDSLDPSELSPSRKKTETASQNERGSSGTALHSIVNSSNESDSIMQPIPRDNSTLIRIRIERLQSKIEEVRLRTKEDLKCLEQEYSKRKAMITEKVMTEKENGDPIEAIMCLHKLIVNDYHQQGRDMKKEMKLMKQGITREVAISIELTKESQELQEKTNSVLEYISRLQCENARHSRELQYYQDEYRVQMRESRNEFQFESTVAIGDMADYDIPTLAPFYRKWRKPVRRDTSRVLEDSYMLPKSSIFYDVLKDDDYKLTFTA